ncbi:hypothetical protein JHN47_21510 [Streptomyces sp. MBT62]|nr:hypothetical protein [Streptomyces sp. MBT62]
METRAAFSPPLWSSRASKTTTVVERSFESWPTAVALPGEEADMRLERVRVMAANGEVANDWKARSMPLDKTFRAFTPDQTLLMPMSLDDWLPKAHLARFVAELVDEDWTATRASHTERRGYPAPTILG